MKTHLVSLLVLGFNLASAAVMSHAAEGDLKQATYCHGFKEDHSPKDTAEFFNQDETVFLSVELKGRPNTGVVSAKFMFREDLIAEAKVDVATVNKGVLFSVGEDTFVSFDLKPTKPLPVGACYRADVTLDGKPLGQFPFRIAPPKDALLSQFLSATLAKGADEARKAVNVTHDFEEIDTVFLVGTADLGLASWMEATWTVNGKPDDAGTRSFTMEENKAKVPFTFSFIPEGGWPVGNHEVSLQLNGQEVAHEKFTVKAGDPMAGAKKLDIVSAQLFQDDGKGEAGDEVKAFSSTDKQLHARWNLKQATVVKGVQIAWVLVEVDDEKEQTLVTVDVEPGVNDKITTTLGAKKGMPPGKYRIDLLQGGKVLDSKPFEVK